MVGDSPALPFIILEISKFDYLTIAQFAHQKFSSLTPSVFKISSGYTFSIFLSLSQMF
ncbi:hypothetical protein EV142_109132 [Flavobacterium circumlabens]|uniref:Uncharacterized protein n=1 Tax=Flavobacterium circumlabens TaxID=2133765 RepID=A0ABY2AUC4_9FLAO|nr:hypothetical protein EV142_109132 [Flavobacterium circumlabens]